MALLRRLFLLVIGTLAGLLLVEVAVRVSLAADGRPYSASAQTETLRDAVRSARQTFAEDTDEPQRPGARPADAADKPDDKTQFRLHPYLGYARENLDEDLIRTLRRDDADRLVVIVGGSVAAIFGNYAAPMLGDSPTFADNRLVPLRLAVAGYKQPQQLHLIAHLFSLGIRPAMVINLDGFNEVALGAANAEAQLDPSQPSKGHWLALASATSGSSARLEQAARILALGDRIDRSLDRAESFGLLRSAVLGRVVLDGVRDLDRELREARAAFLALTDASGVPVHLIGPRREEADPITNSVRIWANSSRAMRALCEANGVVYLHVLQPTLHDAGSKPLSEAEVASGRMPGTWADGAKRGYPRLRSAGGQLAADGELFLDASMVFAEVEKDLYYDGCHFNRDGNRILSDAISAFLAQAVADGRVDLGR